MSCYASYLLQLIWQVVIVSITHLKYSSSCLCMNTRPLPNGLIILKVWVGHEILSDIMLTSSWSHEHMETSHWSMSALMWLWVSLHVMSLIWWSESPVGPFIQVEFSD
jgi:hypothetical protein